MSTPTATSGSSRLAMLTEAWRAFLRDCPLPEPALVSLDPATNRITIQVGGIRDSLDHLGELLLWAYTLEQVSAQWWHTPTGDLHITVAGRTRIGVAFKIYGGIPWKTALASCSWRRRNPRTSPWMSSTPCSDCSESTTRPSPRR